MNLTPPEKNAVSAMEMLLQMSKVRVTRQTLKNKLLQHPDFPSLASLSETLDELKIANMAIRLSSERLPEMPLPAVAYLKIEGGIFAPIRTVSNSIIEWLHTNKGWQRESVAKFDQIWDGIILLIEPNEQSGEADYNKKRRLEIIESFRFPFVLAGLLLCLSLIFAMGIQNYPPNIYEEIYTLLGIKMTGFIISSLLIWYSIDSTNVIIKNICQLNGRTGCQNILDSKASKLFDWLSWSEIGLFYFSGGLITLLLSTIVHASSTVQYLLILNFLALPYTFFSIYYQAFVAKKWCLLCVCTQLLLWIEFAVGSKLWLSSALPTSIQTFGVLSFSFLLMPLLWASVKPSLQKFRQFDWTSKEYNKIRFDPYYVRGLLNRKRKLPPIFEGMKVPTIGNPTADHTLIVVINPSCKSCVKTHEEIEVLLKNTSDIKCQFILASSQAPGVEAGVVARRILSLPTTVMPQALREWFEDSNLRRWVDRTKNMEECRDGSNQLNLHLRWCELAEVNKAPIIFFNNAELTHLYSITELNKLKSIIVNNGFDQIT